MPSYISRLARGFRKQRPVHVPDDASYLETSVGGYYIYLHAGEPVAPRTRCTVWAEDGSIDAEGELAAPSNSPAILDAASKRVAIAFWDGHTMLLADGRRLDLATSGQLE